MREWSDSTMLDHFKNSYCMAKWNNEAVVKLEKTNFPWKIQCGHWWHLEHHRLK